MRGEWVSWRGGRAGASCAHEQPADEGVGPRRVRAAQGSGWGSHRWRPARGRRVGPHGQSLSSLELGPRSAGLSLRLRHLCRQVGHPQTSRLDPLLLLSLAHPHLPWLALPHRHCHSTHTRPSPHLRVRSTPLPHSTPTRPTRPAAHASIVLPRLTQSHCLPRRRLSRVAECARWSS